MAIEEILEALGSNSKLADEVKGIYGANTANVERIGTLESELNGAIDKKSKVVNLVRENLGLSEVSEEALKAFSQGGDEAIKKDNQTLQQKLQEMQGRLEETETGYNKKIDTMILKDTLRGLGIDKRTANEVALEELTNILLTEAKRDGSQFEFKDSEGRTRFTDNGKPMTVEDRVNELSQGDRSFLFTKTTGAGTPQGGITSNGAVPPQGVASYVTDKFL